MTIRTFYITDKGEKRAYGGPLKTEPFIAWVWTQDPQTFFDWEDSQGCACVKFCAQLKKKWEVEVWTDHYTYLQKEKDGTLTPITVQIPKVLTRVFKKLRNMSERMGGEKMMMTYGWLREQLKLSALHTDFGNGGVVYDES